jgi:hypothetical protein
MKTLKGQILVDFIVEHIIDVEDEIGYITSNPWNLYFNGSACKDGQGVSIVIISPDGAINETSSRLDYFYTNNQAEYEALLFKLEILQSMEVRHVEAFGDSLLVIQQVTTVFQSLIWKNHLMHILINVFTSLFILLNSKFGIFQGIKIIRLTCWLNKH